MFTIEYDVPKEYLRGGEGDSPPLWANKGFVKRHYGSSYEMSKVQARTRRYLPLVAPV